ncbi:MAG: hypothetical protein OER86_05180, partial [Phycisphaerae bacterium]|nr:hypothetical protein [Phycisphaerae bacterium]
MAKRHTVLVLLAVFSLAVVTFFALETSAQNDQTAAQLLQQGIKLLGDGKPGAARQLLRRVDPIQLTRAQRLQLQQALQKANAAPSGPDPAPEPPAPEPEPEAPKTPEPAPEPEPAPAPAPPPPAPSAPPADAGAALELLRDGIKLLDAGKPAQALTQLRLVDPVPLTRPQRLELLEAISKANAQLKPAAVPTPPAPAPPTPPAPEPPTPPAPEPPAPP